MWQNHKQPALYWRTNFWSTQNFTTIGVAYFWVLFPQLEDQVTYSIFWQNSLEQLRLCVIHAFKKLLWGGIKSYRCERFPSKKAFPDVLCFIISWTATSCCTLMHPVWLHHTPETPKNRGQGNQTSNLCMQLLNVLTLLSAKWKYRQNVFLVSEMP